MSRTSTAFGARFLWLGLGAAVCLCGAKPANAQLVDNIVLPSVPGYDVGPGVTVLSRPRPDYESPGVRVGDFIIRPTVAEGIGYNDNVLGTPGTGSSPSALVDTSATVQVNSDWGRNSVGGLAAVDDTRFLEQPSQSQTNWNASLGGTYELGEDQLTAAASHLRRHEGVAGLDAFNTSVPLPYDVDDVRANYLTSFGRFSIRPQLDYTEFRFDPLSQSEVDFDPRTLNRDASQGSLNAQYELAPQRILEMTLQGTRQHYVDLESTQPSRDSTSGSVMVGFDYALDGNVRTFLLAGYQLRHYDYGLYKQHGAVVGTAGLIWTPTGLTTVTATAQRSIEDSTDESLVGYTLTQAGLRVDHEYLRNVILDSTLQVARAAYEESSVTQTLYTAGAGATWLLNRHLSLKLQDEFTDRQSNAGGNYRGNTVLLQFGAAL